MNCERNLELMNPYVDGELDAPTALDLEHHMERCTQCDQARRRLTGLRSSIAARAPYFKAPPALAAQIRSRLNLTPEPRVVRLFPWRPLAVAAALVIVCSLTWIIARQSDHSAADLSHELVSAHVRSTMADHIFDVKSSDQHTVKPWFAGKLDFSLPVKDLAADGFPLLGGRLDYISGRSVAALVYGRALHKINCFVWPTDRDESPVTTTQTQGYTIVQFTHGGLAWYLVSDASRETLEQLAGELRSNGATQK
jgi:anti-sigma factor RsiW